MTPKPTAALDDVHPQMLRASGEGDRKKLADRRGEIGSHVERTLQLLGITKQDASYRLGYSDPGTMSRWCAGTERPHFDKLVTLDGWDVAWMKARLEQHPRWRLISSFEVREIA